MGSRRSRGGRRHYYTKRRYGRSVEDETDMMAEILLQASRNDEQDCAKKLVCVLNAQNDLAEDETKIAQLFGKSGNIDLLAVTVEFDLAALIGQQAGEYQCNTIYSRCPYQVKDLMEIIRQPPKCIKKISKNIATYYLIFLKKIPQVYFYSILKNIPHPRYTS